MADLSFGNLDFDVEQLSQISGGDTAFEQELLQLYVDATAEHLTKIEAAIAPLDITEIEELAHHVKGSSLNIGLIEMARCAENLEKSAHQEQSAVFHSLSSQMGGIFNQFRSYLQAESH